MLGKSYGEARRCFDNAVLCGVLNTDTDRAQLNPPDSCVVDSNHKLIFLSDTARIKPTQKARLRNRDT